MMDALFGDLALSSSAFFCDVQGWQSQASGHGEDSTTDIEYIKHNRQPTMMQLTERHISQAMIRHLGLRIDQAG